MTGRSLLTTYMMLREIGITRSKRDFSIRILGRGKTFVRDFEHREGRDVVQVPPRTVARLRAQLRSLADRMPPKLRFEIEAIIGGIDRDDAVAELLARR